MSEQFGYKVRISQYCDHSENISHGDGEWDFSWEESYSNSFESVVKTDKYPDITALHDFEVGDQAFLVWAEWSTGDSFGHGDRSHVEAFALFKNSEDAYAYAHALEHAPDGKKFKFVSSEGQVFENIYMPWHGYFESLDNIHVETVTIGA